ncbi:MAG: hypothetical protein ACI8Q1_000319 [Parvicella sp.]|jgi:hypothetical protein
MMFVVSAIAKLDPYYKEVLQRGYELIPGDSVKFPDGSKCSISKFNEGLCGQQWKTKDYCVAIGGEVWDENVCCEGLETNLAGDTDGQITCQPIADSWFSQSTVVNFFIGLLIPLGLFVFLGYNVKRKLKERNVRN